MEALTNIEKWSIANCPVLVWNRKLLINPLFVNSFHNPSSRSLLCLFSTLFHIHVCSFVAFIICESLASNWWIYQTISHWHSPFDSLILVAWNYLFAIAEALWPLANLKYPVESATQHKSEMLYGNNRSFAKCYAISFRECGEWKLSGCTENIFELCATEN